MNQNVLKSLLRAFPAFTGSVEKNLDEKPEESFGRSLNGRVEAEQKKRLSITEEGDVRRPGAWLHRFYWGQEGFHIWGVKGYGILLGEKGFWNICKRHKYKCVFKMSENLF